MPPRRQSRATPPARGGARARRAPVPLYSPEAPQRGRTGAAARPRSAAAPPANQYTAARANVRTQLAKIRQAEALLEAYEQDGWRGASREKLRPEAELAAARRRVLEAKLRIRDCLRVMDEASGDEPIPLSSFDAEGEVDEADIFCACCREVESTDDNDIVLCDGECRRAYHLGCLTPPLRLEDLPPDDEGWLCPACDAKVDSLWAINQDFGTCFGLATPWTDVFADVAADVAAAGDAAAAATAHGALAEADWPSDEEDDEDFDPTAADAVTPGAAPRAAGGGSDADEDDDEDEEDESDDEGSSEDESEDDDAAPRSRRRTRAARAAAGAESDDVDDADAVLDEGSESSESEPAVVLEGKRRRAVVDYQALNQELFGGGDGASDGSLFSDADEDWRSLPSSPVAGAPKPKAPKAAKADVASGSGAGGAAGAAGGAGGGRRGRQGFLPAVLSVLEGAFSVEPLPDAATRQALAHRTGLSVAQVTTWMNNARQRRKRQLPDAQAAASGGGAAEESDEGGSSDEEGGAAAARKGTKRRRSGSGGGAAAAAAAPQSPPPRRASAGVSPRALGAADSPPTSSPAAAAGTPATSSRAGRYPPAVTAALEALFGSSGGNPDLAARAALAAATGLSKVQVRVWMQHTRARRNVPSVKKAAAAQASAPE